MPWVKGQSGNPKGIQGTGKRRAKLLAALDAKADGVVDELLDSYINQARQGNMEAMNFIMGHVWTKRRGRPVILDLPPMDASTDLPKVTAAVVNAVANGVLSPEEGASFNQLLETHRKAVELCEIDERLKRLEAMAPASKEDHE